MGSSVLRLAESLRVWKMISNLSKAPQEQSQRYPSQEHQRLSLSVSIS